MTSRMFPFISRTWNPIKGRCPFQCEYCWAQGSKGLIKRYNLKAYLGSPKLVINQTSFPQGGIVFVGDMIDLFSSIIPDDMLRKVFEVIEQNPQTNFLFLTKNPQRYLELLDELPDNTILGATIESDRNYPEISKAPKQTDRIIAMMKLRDRVKRGHKLFVSIEPILDFSILRFSSIIEMIGPWKVAIGYDNYNHHLLEPSLKKTKVLIAQLERFTKVVPKTIRPAWWENASTQDK